MSDTLAFALLCLTSFFLSQSDRDDADLHDHDCQPGSESRSRTALASIVAFLTPFFSFSGQLLFQFFGISVNSFQVVGGMIFFLTWTCQARLNKVKSAKQRRPHVRQRHLRHPAGHSDDRRTRLHDQCHCPDGRCRQQPGKAILIGSIFLVMTFYLSDPLQFDQDHPGPGRYREYRADAPDGPDRHGHCRGIPVLRAQAHPPGYFPDRIDPVLMPELPRSNPSDCALTGRS